MSNKNCSTENNNEATEKSSEDFCGFEIKVPGSLRDMIEAKARENRQPLSAFVQETIERHLGIEREPNDDKQEEKPQIDLWRVCNLANQIKAVKALLEEFADGMCIGIGLNDTQSEESNILHGVGGILDRIAAEIAELPNLLEEVRYGEREIT